MRGTYDVSGLRADADLMIWWHSATSEALQTAYNDFRRTALGSRMAPVWSQMAVHRPAEFNKSHVPAFMADEWILAFEADMLHRIVDLMRTLRASRARRHVREEIPFYTGRAHTMTELTTLWP